MAKMSDRSLNDTLNDRSKDRTRRTHNKQDLVKRFGRQLREVSIKEVFLSSKFEIGRFDDEIYLSLIHI